MSNINIYCYFCSWTGEIDNKLNFTCPSCDAYFGALDDDGRQRANQIITEFIEKYQTGRTDFPVAEDIAFACYKLQTLSGKAVNSQSRKLFSLFWKEKGIQYSKVLPLIIKFQALMNNFIDNSRFLITFEQEWVPLREDELPF